MEVGIKELKNNLSRYIARVRDGAEVAITARGRVVARLTGVEDRGLDRLIADGLVEPPRHPKGKLEPPTVRLRGKGPSMAQYVLEDRR